MVGGRNVTAVRAERGEAECGDVGIVDGLTSQHTFEFNLVGTRADTLERNIDVTCATDEFPSACVLPAYGTIAIQVDKCRRLVGFVVGVLVVGMSNQLVVTNHFVGAIELRSCDFGCRNGFAAEFVGSSDEPSVLVDKHLMDTHLMTFGAVVETGVINQKCTAFMIDDSRVVPLGKFGSRHGIPLVVGQNLHTDAATDVAAIIEDVAIVDGRLSGGCAAVFIGSIGLLAAEDANLVATIGHKTSVAHEKVVPVADMLDVGCFARDIVSAGNFSPEVGVAGHVAIGRGG